MTPDQIAAIQARVEAAKGIIINGHSLPPYAIRDREYLLALVREQQAQIERALGLADELDAKPGHRWASSKLRAALTVTHPGTES